VKPSIADTMKLNVYADNWFMLYVNGRLVAVDPIQFTPHNVVSVDFLPEYPMTIAVLAKDNADPKTGMEYGTSIGDGGFCLKFADGTVTNATWKAKNFFHGPVNGDTANPQVIQEPLPANWWATDFDDSTWKHAKEYTIEEVDPKQPYFENDFEGAKFIWTDDIALDNTVIFRTKVEKPGWTPRWNTKPDLDVTGLCRGCLIARRPAAARTPHAWRNVRRGAAKARTRSVDAAGGVSSAGAAGHAASSRGSRGKVAACGLTSVDGADDRTELHVLVFDLHGPRAGGKPRTHSCCGGLRRWF
jgi:hypothetical protein